MELEPANEAPTPTIEERWGAIRDIQGRLAAGEIVQAHEVSPKVHGPEVVAAVHQALTRQRLTREVNY